MTSNSTHTSKYRYETQRNKQNEEGSQRQKREKHADVGFGETSYKPGLSKDCDIMEFDRENDLPSNMHRIAMCTSSNIEHGQDDQQRDPWAAGE